MSDFDKKLAEFGIDVKHHFSPQQYIKEVFIPANRVLVQHKHTFDHHSFLLSGSVLVSVDGAETQYVGPRLLLIKAGKHHGVRALTDAVWFCINETDCADEDEVDATLIENEDRAEMQAVIERLS